jgi:hypothetical protein
MTTMEKRRFAFDVALLLTLRPVVCAEHRSSWRHEPARVFAPGEAGCRSVHRQARDGLSMDPATSEKRRAPGQRASAFALVRRKPRGMFFWLLFLRQEK